MTYSVGMSNLDAAAHVDEEQDATEQKVLDFQAERTDLPLVVMPVVVDSMIPFFTTHLHMLHDIARVRMYTDFTRDEATVIERTKDADALLMVGLHISDTVLESFSGHVKCMVFSGTGVASYVDLVKVRDLGIRVCNVRHYGDHAVTEHTYALLFELIRHVGKLNEQVHAGDWTGADGIALSGKTISLVGFGGIGQTVARIAQAFGMHVLVWNSHLDESAVETIGVTPVDDMGDLFHQSDIISLHMPLLDATRGLITAEHLEHMRPGTLFVNTARAEIIEPGALTARLLRGDIPAALDVFDREPLPLDDPIRNVPGIILTPHVAWRNDEAYAENTRQMVQAIVAFYKGESYNVLV